jgi:hypothetical protein
MQALGVDDTTILLFSPLLGWLPSTVMLPDGPAALPAAFASMNPGVPLAPAPALPPVGPPVWYA